MVDIPENLQNRISHINATRQAATERERENAAYQEQLRQQDIEANVEALNLGRQYVELLREAGAPSVNIYDNFPRIKQDWLLMNRIAYSFANQRTTRPDDVEIDEMLAPTGEGWIIGYGQEYSSLEGGWFKWSYAIDSEGQILTSFEETVYAADLLQRKEHGIGKGIFHPHREYGRHALTIANDKKFLDGLAWILEGNDPKKREY